MTKIDWTKPVETTDGLPCTVESPNRVAINAPHQWAQYGPGWPAGKSWYFDDDGSSAGMHTIRNVIEQPTTDPLVERMKALIGWMLLNNPKSTEQDGIWDEARAIMAELNPVDPDLLEARKMAASANPNASGEMLAGLIDNCMGISFRLEGIKRGRELAKSETGHD